MQCIKRQLETANYFLQPPYLPQLLPLTAGEVLGCTAPKLRPTAAAAAAAAAADAAATAAGNGEEGDAGGGTARAAATNTTAAASPATAEAAAAATPATPTAAAAAAAALGTALACGSSCNACDDALESKSTLCLRGPQGAPQGPLGEDTPEIDTVVFLADGRFHLEASLIQNPGIKFLRYDPFTKVNPKP